MIKKIKHPSRFYILALISLIPLCAISTPAEINKALSLSPELDNGKKIYTLCANCHMENGWGKKDGSFPVVAGQHRNVLIKQLTNIRSKNRDNPTMYPFTDPASMGGSQGVADVTAYISTMPVNPQPGTGNGKRLALGKKLYFQHCTQCHGEDALGNNEAFFPRLKGQHHMYLLRQLQWIRDGYRKNSNPVMQERVKALSDDELSAIADYLSRL